MKRIKDLEYKWILKDSFVVHAYLCGTKDGKTFVVMAHDFNDMDTFLNPTGLEDRTLNTILTVMPALCLIGIMLSNNRELRVTKIQNKLLWKQNELLLKERELLWKLLSPILEEDK